MENKIKLSKLSAPFKTLITGLVLSLMVGYSVALVQVYHRTSFDSSKTVQYYRGVESENELEATPPPSFATLLSVAHVHSLSQPLMLTLMGFCFALSYVTDKAKVIFIALSYLSSFTSNLTPFLIRYVGKQFSVLLPLSQMILLFTFFIMAFVVLYDTWGNKNDY